MSRRRRDPGPIEQEPLRDSSPPALRGHARWLAPVSAGFMPAFLILLGLILDPAATFAQWDNMEIFLPSILFAHRRILHGELPLWNQFQNMGEPLHAMGTGGVLYPPYTLCTWLVDLMGWHPGRLMDAIVVLHAGFAGLGLYALARSFGARPLLSLAAAVSGALSGFALLMGSVWIHTMPNLAWSAWSLWAIKELIDFRRPARAAVMGAVSLAMPFSVGHVQPAVYIWIASGLFAVSYAVMRRRVRSRLPLVAATALAGALLAMPSVLPTASLLPESSRTGAFSREAFLDRGVRPAALLGLLLPTYGLGDGFMEAKTLIATHSGAWLLPALLAGVAVLVSRARSKERGESPPGDGLQIREGIALNGILAALLVALSLGGNAPLYGWTHGIPIWSSFRWPFKLFPHAIPFLAVAGAVSLELLARERTDARRRVLVAALALAALLVWIARPGLSVPSAWAAGVLGLAAMVSIAWLDRPAGRALLLLAAVAAAGSLVFFVQRPDRFKTYPREKTGGFGAREWGVSTDYRLMAVSASEPPGEFMRDLGLFHSATLGGYYALTGHHFALTSWRLRSCLPAHADGLLPRDLARKYLTSHLLRSFNTRYVLAAKSDSEMVATLEREPGYERIRELPHAHLYANADARERFYFATEVHTFSPRVLFGGLMENRLPPTAAVVTGGGVGASAASSARVERWSWDHERVYAEVTAPDGGFLVVSMSYSPDWVATVDGEPVPLWVTNGAIMGLEVPAGGRSVELTYRPASLRRGAWLAGLGLVVLSGLVAFLTRGGRRREREEKPGRADRRARAPRGAAAGSSRRLS